MPKLTKRAAKDQDAQRSTKLMQKPMTPEQQADYDASAIVRSFEKYIENHDADLKQKAVNYAFLAGKTYYEMVFDSTSKQWGVRESINAPLANQERIFLSFDKISDQYANILGIFPEAIPHVGVMKRLNSPINDSVSRTAQDIIDYHIEHEWKLNEALAVDIMPNLYPGATCWAYLAPKYRGTRKVVVQKDGTVARDMVVNEDGSVKYYGSTIPASSTLANAQPGEQLNQLRYSETDGTVMPAELARQGMTIREQPEFVTVFNYVPVFDVAVYGKKKTAKDCVKLIYQDRMTISDLKMMFSGQDEDGKNRYQEQLDIIDKAAELLENTQDQSPETQTERYKAMVGLSNERDILLEGDDRNFTVYYEWHNPTSQHKNGRVSLVIGNKSGAFKMLWQTTELPWGLKSIPWVCFAIDGNPAGSSIKKSPIEGMIGAQVGRDRLLNSQLKNAGRNANPPETWLDGVQFSTNGGNFKKVIDPCEDSTVSVMVPKDVRMLAKEVGQLRFSHQETSMAAVDGFINTMDEQFRAASHQRSSAEGPAPKSVSGTSVENQYNIDKQDLNTQLVLIQGAVFDAVQIAWQIMKYTYTPGQRFRYSGGVDELEDAVWMQEIVGDELDLFLKSRIGQPLTKQAKLQEMQIEIGLAQAAATAGVDIGKLAELKNMDSFAFSYHQEEPEYEFAKLRLLYLVKELEPPALVDTCNLALHLAIITEEINGKRFHKYNKSQQARINKEMHIITAMMKQKENIMAAMAPQPPTPGGPGAPGAPEGPGSATGGPGGPPQALPGPGANAGPVTPPATPNQ